jgi:predicted ATP-binding protein involved in virulence
MFRFQSLRVKNYRCFEELELPFEEDLTVLFAENGGGKTALLTAIAMGIAVFQPRSPRELKLDALRDTRRVVVGDGRQQEAAGSCCLSWKATITRDLAVEWALTVNPASGRMTKKTDDVLDAIEGVRVPGERWPLFAWYGTDRMRIGQRSKKHSRSTQDRWDGYSSSLNPSITDAPLLEWLEAEILGDVVRHRQGESERRFDECVMSAMVRATPNLAEIWYDPVARSPVARLANGSIASWSDLSDGFHVFLALVGDIARRAIVLNELDGRQATERIEGVVLIDEIDLHLHPRWQRVVMEGLRNAFPNLQFVVTTHSPQVLSSVENRQVRHVSNAKWVEHGVYVEGRDSNAILRELMRTDDRDDEGVRDLRELHAAIDQGRRADAERLFQELLARWGDLDQELIRARGLMEWEDSDA